jgi:hypothetical protein
MASAKDGPAPTRDEPWLAARIEAALAPYAAVLSAEELAWMREQVAEALANDPDAADVVARADPRTRDRSGEVKRRSADGGDVTERRKSKG